MDIHPRAPWTDVTFIGVYWHEEERLPDLLDLAGCWFTHAVIGVQANEDDDATLKIAREWVAESPDRKLIVDKVRGLAEPTLHTAVASASTPWSFVVSGDEWPEEKLLWNFDAFVALAHADDYVTIDGFWVPFLSSIEGIEYESEQDRHLRLFQTRLGWPATMHSRPPAHSQHILARGSGVIHHRRSLAEMMEDYLRYYARSSGNPDWEAHNRLMMHDACVATARSKGWEFVRDFAWWPDVERVAFARCETACGMPYAGYDCHPR